MEQEKQKQKDELEQIKLDNYRNSQWSTVLIMLMVYFKDATMKFRLFRLFIMLKEACTTLDKQISIEKNILMSYDETHGSIKNKKQKQIWNTLDRKLKKLENKRNKRRTKLFNEHVIKPLGLTEQLAHELTQIWVKFEY